MLTLQIHGLQANGYGLPAIAELLSDNCLAVTATTLKTYLSEARAAGGRENRRKPRCSDPSPIELWRYRSDDKEKRAVEAHSASGDARPELGWPPM